MIQAEEGAEPKKSTLRILWEVLTFLPKLLWGVLCLMGMFLAIGTAIALGKRKHS